MLTTLFMKRTVFGKYLVVSLVTALSMAAPAWAANLGNIKTKTITMLGETSVLQRKGAKPVTIKDNLAVRGNITLSSGRTVDGVDVSILKTDLTSLETLVASITGLPVGCAVNQVAKFDGTTWNCANDIDTDTDTVSGTTYTAGTGIAIANGVISSTVVDTDTNTTYTAGSGLTLNGTQFAVSGVTSGMITDTTVAASDLAANAVDAAALASSAIQTGDIEAADLPSLSSDNLSDVAALAMLDEAETIVGNWVNTTNPWNDSEVDNALTITSGSINGASIGAIAPESGNFSSLSVDGAIVSQLPSPYYTKEARSVELASQTFTTPIAAIIGSDNLPFVVYGKSFDQQIYSVTCNTEACDDITATNTITSTGAAGAVAIDVVVGQDGFPQIAYYDGALGDLIFIDCSNLTCTSKTVSTLDDTAALVGKSADIIIGPDGFPQIAYIDDTSDNVKIFDCGNATCSSGNTTSTVDTGTIGDGVAFAAAPDGRGVLVYETSGAPDVLTYARCDNTTCTAVTSATLDASAVLKARAAIAVGDDLLPIIVYIDDTNIITLHCGNITCDSGNVSTTQYASASSLNDYVDITIGADSHPLISFSDYASAVNGPLYITYCATTDCASAANVDAQQSAAASINSAGEQNLIIRANGLPQIVVGGDILELLSPSNKFFVDHLTRE